MQFGYVCEVYVVLGVDECGWECQCGEGGEDFEVVVGGDVGFVEVEVEGNEELVGVVGGGFVDVDEVVVQVVKVWEYDCVDDFVVVVCEVVDEVVLWVDDLVEVVNFFVDFEEFWD